MDRPIDYLIPPQKDKARYKMHKYWAGKPWYVVAEYIRYFTQVGDLVLDPFCGKGVVGCEALIQRRRAILRDINPMATFIAEGVCMAPVDLQALQQAFDKIKAKVKADIMEMYRLEEPCSHCGGNIYAKHLVRGPALKGKWLVEGRCENRHGRSGHFRRPLNRAERTRLLQLEDQDIPYWYPKDEISQGRETMRLINAGIWRVDQLFTRRNLLALSMLYREIIKVGDPSLKKLLTLGFSNTLLHVTKLKSEKLRPMSANSYYCMGDWIEENVWMRFENRMMWHWGVMKGKRQTNKLIGSYYKKAQNFPDLQANKSFLLETGPAQKLAGIPDRTVDYVFTDPPYGGTIQYQELTILWRSWLKMSYKFSSQEITVNDYQEKGHADFEAMLTEALEEIGRVLKPDKWLTITFNHRDQEVWSALLQACELAGFELKNVVPQEPLGNSFVQSWAGNALKRDMILNFKKTKKLMVSPGGLKVKGCEKKPLNAKDIVLMSAREHLQEKGQATLVELFEAAIIQSLTLTRGNPRLKVGDRNVDGVLHMEFVDETLAQEPGFTRRICQGTICYEISQQC